MTNTVQIAGDTGALTLEATNLTGPSPLEFLSGSFRGCVEEKRVASVFLVTGGGTKTFELRFDWTDPALIEHSVAGAAVFADDVGIRPWRPPMR